MTAAQVIRRGDALALLDDVLASTRLGQGDLVLVAGAIKALNDCRGDPYDVLPLGDVLYSVGHPHVCSWIRS